MNLPEEHLRTDNAVIRKPKRRKRWYSGPGAQVLIAMVLGAGVGFAFPETATKLKIVGDLFLELVKAGVAPLVFFTVVMGIASAGDLKKAGKIALRALIYFEVISTIALVMGLLAGNLFGVGRGAGALRADSGKPPAAAEEGEHGVDAFLRGIVPDNFVGAFSSGQLLQVVILAVIFGIGLLALKPVIQSKVNAGLEVVSETFFGFVNVVMKLAPFGAFGAIAYSVGANGSAMLLRLAELVMQYWLVVGVFVCGVLGLVCLLAGFNIFRIMQYFRVELTLVLGTASSESALPGLLKKLTRMGCSKQAVGLVVPTGYAFNLDGTSLYMSMCTLFLANVYGIPMGLPEQIGVLLLMLLTSKGAATVSGGSFVVFASTVAATGYLPLEGVAILFGVYRFMSMAIATCNTIGNIVATLVVARWSKDMDTEKVKGVLADPSAFLARSEAEDAAAEATEAAREADTPEAGRATVATGSTRKEAT